MINLNTDDYSLFTANDYKTVIGINLDTYLLERGTGQSSKYAILYASNLIRSYIQEHTGNNIYKIYDKLTPDTYSIKMGKSMKKTWTLSEEQIKALKLASIYLADYFIENGSPERMLGVAISGKGYKIARKDLKEFEMPSISISILTNAGLIYTGSRSYTNGWFQ